MNQDYDYIILGSGIAGLFSALLASEHGSVLVLTKGNIDDCNTRYAQGGIAAAIGQSDSPQQHMEDTLGAGGELCNPEAVRILTNEGPSRITDLIHLGVPFDTIEGEIALAKEGAHSLPRVLHAGGDATGLHIEQSLAEQIRRNGIKVMEHTLARKLVVERGTVIGVEAMNTQTQKSYHFSSGSMILATGGAGQIYRYTTNPTVATGDGVALAFRAGAQIMDMEFYQFHPTALRLQGAPTFLMSEAMRGEGATLLNVNHKPFMLRYHPLGDLAPRDHVSRAIVSEMQTGNSEHVFLDITHLSSDKIRSRFPTIYAFCLKYGLDITTSYIPVAPAAHYMMGGVKTNLWGQTSLSSLYACGETSCCSIHGANRLASNSLLETLVFARRVVDQSVGKGADDTSITSKETVHYVGDREINHIDLPKASLSNIQDLMWRSLGMIRNGSNIVKAIQTLYAWSNNITPHTGRSGHELDNLVLVGRLIGEAALLREESRGAHFREDFPSPVTQWIKHIILERQDE